MLSQVPTAKEAGYGQFGASTWFGMFARAGTPPPILEALNAAIRDVMASPALAGYLNQRGAVPSQRGVAEFQKFFHQEISLWRDVIAKADIKVE
ncbi:Tripartite tricarboxylate transporter family receptor [compost metagenome]